MEPQISQSQQEFGYYLLEDQGIGAHRTSLKIFFFLFLMLGLEGLHVGQLRTVDKHDSNEMPNAYWKKKLETITVQEHHL